MRAAIERDPAPPPSWAVPEVAWFAALIGGFVCAWAGAETRVPGAGAFLAGVFATGYQVLLLRRGSDGGAAMVAGAALLGVLVGAVALHEQAGPEAARRAFPLAAFYVERQIVPLLGGGEPGLVPAAVSAAALAAALVCARATSGLVPLLGGAALAGAMGVAAPIAVGGGAAREVSVLQSLHSVPPWALLQLAGLVLAQTVLASPEPVLPWEDLRPVRRRLLAAGLGLCALGVAVQPVLDEPWGAWVPSLS